MDAPLAAGAGGAAAEGSLGRPAPERATGGQIEQVGWRKLVAYFARRAKLHFLTLLVAVLLATLVLWRFSDPSFLNFQCAPPAHAIEVLQVVNGARKGLCIDQTTWNMCPNKIPATWPLTHEPVQSLRMFQPESWQDEGAWEHLKVFLTHTNSQVIVATPVSCNKTYDDESWTKTTKLLVFLGRDKVLALAVGNEIELLSMKADTPKDCAAGLVDHFLASWHRYIYDLGVVSGGAFGDLPVTTVMTAAALTSEDNSWTPQSMRLVDGSKPGSMNLEAVFASIFSTVPVQRFIFTFNIYPYFVPCPQGCGTDCDNCRRNGVCMDDPAQCLTPRTAAGARYALRKFAQGHAAGVVTPLRLWIGEVGWSSPRADSLDDSICSQWQTSPCEGWSNMDMLATYYRSFLAWDLGIGEGLEPPERAFYFTIRDSFNFHSAEHFGLCGKTPRSEAELGDACSNDLAKFS